MRINVLICFSYKEFSSIFHSITWRKLQMNLMRYLTCQVGEWLGKVDLEWSILVSVKYRWSLNSTQGWWTIFSGLKWLSDLYHRGTDHILIPYFLHVLVKEAYNRDCQKTIVILLSTMLNPKNSFMHFLKVKMCLYADNSSCACIKPWGLGYVQLWSTRSLKQLGPPWQSLAI